MRTVLLVLLFALSGCSRAAPIPERSSPRAVLARPFGEGSRIVDVDPDHEAWASVGGDRLELQTPDGVVLSMPWESWHGWLHVDVAPDATAALCTEREVRVVDGGVEEILGLEAIVTGGDFSRCAGIATRGGGDVVLLLEADPTRTFPLPPSEVPPPRLCHRASGRWRCRAIPTTPASLALTAGHVWWLASGTLFTVDTLDFESDPL